MVATLSDGNLTITIRGTPRVGRVASVQYRARVPAQDLPGSTTDDVQFLGRKARTVTIPEGVAYTQGDHASETTALNLLKTWLDGGTVLTYTSPTEPSGIRVIIAELEIQETSTLTGIPYTLRLIETTLSGGAVHEACMIAYAALAVSVTLGSDITAVALSSASVVLGSDLTADALTGATVVLGSDISASAGSPIDSVEVTVP